MSERSESRHLYIVLRFDPAPAGVEFDVEAQVVATKAYASKLRADEESKRLNRLNGPKGATYFVVVARLQSNHE